MLFVLYVLALVAVFSISVYGFLLIFESQQVIVFMSLFKSFTQICF